LNHACRLSPCAADFVFRTAGSWSGSSIYRHGPDP
jgi:hypothetical protein